MLMNEGLPGDSAAASKPVPGRTQRPLHPQLWAWRNTKALKVPSALAPARTQSPGHWRVCDVWLLPA